MSWFLLGAWYVCTVFESLCKVLQPAQVCTLHTAISYCMSSRSSGLIDAYFFTGSLPLKATIDGKNDKFERNQTDKFVVETAEIGELKKIR